MGWSQGINHEGRTVGYAIAGICENPGCDNKINLGLYYCCGELDGVFGAAGCGHYFCGEHLYYGEDGQRCGRCLDEEEGEDNNDAC